MEKTLEQLTEHIKEGNDNNQLLLIENFVMLSEVHGVLENIESKLTTFFKEYQQRVIAQQEAAAEASRQLPPPPVGDGAGDTGGGDQAISKGGFAGIAALLTVAKMFDVDELIRLPATLTVMFKKIDAFADVVRSAGAMFGRVGQTIGNLLRPLGTVLKPLGTLLSKLALPITIIFGVLDAIEGFTKTYADTGSILRSIRGAIVSVLDGLVGTLVRFAGDIVAFIPDIIGLDAVAETIKNLFGNITDGILTSFGGIVDIILGIFAPGSGQFTEGLKSLFGGLWDALTELLMFPINSVINFVRDIFGFSEEDAPPFRMQDLIGEAVDSIQQWFSDLFDFEFPSFSFDMNSVLRGLLPAPDSFFAKFIPDSVYKSVGLNPQTGEALETPEPSSDEPLKTSVMTNEGFKELTKEEIQEGIKEGTIKRSIGRAAQREISLQERRRGAEIPSQAGEQVQTPRGTGEVTARGAMAIPRAGTGMQQTGVDQQQSGGGFLESITQAASNASQTVSDVIGSTVTTMSDFAATASENIGDFAGRAGEDISRRAVALSQSVSEAGDYISDVSGNVIDIITENVVDPVTSFFQQIGEKIAGVLDISGMLSRIKDYMTNMFAEIGIPRVEMDVPIIGTVGFGPFYPFAPSNETSGGGKTTMNVISAANELKTESNDDQFSKQLTSRVTSIEGVENYDVQYANASERERANMDEARERYGDEGTGSGISLSLRSSLEQSQGESESSQTARIFGRQDYDTGKRYIEVEKTLEKYEGDSAGDIQRTVETYDIGPLQFGKVRRMINEGASAEQVEQYLKETQVTVADRLKSFLAPAASAISGAVEAASGKLENVAAASSEAIGGAQQAVFGSRVTKGEEASIPSEEVTEEALALLAKISLAKSDNIDELTGEQGTVIKGEGSGDYLESETSVALVKELEDKVVNMLGVDSYEQAKDILRVAEKQHGLKMDMSGADEFDFSDENYERITPVENKTLTAPIGESSTNVQAAKQGATNIMAPTTNNISPVNNTNVTNVNRTTVASASPRSNDPSFIRLQAAVA
jgi:hypothetical protein